METASRCPPAIDAALEAAAEQLRAAGADESLLAHALETARVTGALTEHAELSLAVLGASLGPAPASLAAVLDNVLPPEALRYRQQLQQLGELRLGADWRPEQGIGRNQAETLRRMLIATASDPRLIVARLAAVLTGLRAAKTLPEPERRARAIEARAVYVPLANRLGIWQLKWELEDLAFRYLEPQPYAQIAQALAERRVDRERYIAELVAEFSAALTAAGIDAEVHGRPKHIYSIWRKMQRKQLAFEQIFDVRALRIICKSIPDCYAALGLVHGRYRFIPGEFDDYIATPKDNHYRSIHTAIIGPQDKAVEVQIRTREMHEHAELGIAAHWRYKEGGPRDLRQEQRIEWLRQMLASPAAQAPSEDFLEQIRGELFRDRVYALT
ncbi:MAG: HD domain-containing protein, partial [Steroidobacteraceae bacterium]|nr:HD domain-containing protein [Steroidobacteraceae bacterium]MDW8259237.1 HD domain-containing protein [Gammaproteobacteria bacterium]